MDAIITLSATHLDATSGEVSELVAEIRNNQATQGDFLINVRGVDPGWVTVRPPVISVDPNGSSNATILIQPPAGANSAHFAAAVRVVSRDSGEVVDEASVTVNVSGVGSAIAGPDDPATVEPPTRQLPALSRFRRIPTQYLYIGGGVLALLSVVAVLGIALTRDIPDTGSPDDDGEVVAAEPTETASDAAIVPKSCDDQPNAVASLISDDAVTAILLTTSDLNDMRILRTEPADRLSGLFDPLLSLSSDASRLAYVTADNPAMDETTISYLDVDAPGDVFEMVHLSTGFWPVRPSWSPDGQQLAFLRMNEESAEQGDLELEVRVVDAGGVQRTAGSVPASEYSVMADHSTPLCWTEDGGTVIYGGQEVQVEFDLETAEQRTVERTEPPQPDPRADRNPPEPAGTDCGVPIFSQNDPAWRHLVMQTWGDTIGDFGCALTSTAMVLNYYGAAMDPASLNECLGPYAELIHWARAPECAPGIASFVDRADFSWDRLEQVLASGRPAIVGMVRGQTGMHFVVVTAGGGGSGANYAVTDPWDGSTSKTLQTFFNAGYNPAWIVEFSGGGEGNCERVVTGGSPTPLPPDIDGSVHTEPVDIGEMVDEGDDVVVVPIWPPEVQIEPETTPTPAEGGGVVLPPQLPEWLDLLDQPLAPVPVTPDLVLDDEGIYYLIVSSQDESGTTTISRAKFTIDRSPPEIGISAMSGPGGQAGVDAPGWSLAGAASLTSTVPQEPELPEFDDEALLQIQAYDALSGVVDIEFQLDDGDWETYSDDVSFKRELNVDDPGEHTISFRATDLAGNESPERTYEFVVVDSDESTPTPEPTQEPTPTPTPTPEPTPTPSPTPSPTPTPEPRPALEVDPESLDFGEQMIGMIDDPLAVTLVNTSGEPVELIDITIEGENPSDFLMGNENTCRDSSSRLGWRVLGPNQICSLTISFYPTQAGDRSADLVIAHSASDDVLTVPMSGVATETVSLNAVPDSLEFSNQVVDTASQASETRSLNLVVDGAGAVTVTEIEIDGSHAGDFEFETACVNQNVTSSNPCSVEVEFTAGAVGSRMAQLVVEYQGAGARLTVPLSGSGVIG